MNIFLNTEIYLQCPANIKTGGCELMHQLCHTLRRRGQNAFIIYTPPDRQNPTPKEYHEYNCPWVRTIKDEPQNILIVSEVGTEYLYPLQKIRRAIWWLSVDNWYTHAWLVAEMTRKSGFNLKAPKFFWFGQDLDLLHFTQSEYAKHYLLLNGIEEGRIAPLSDYLNHNFLERAKNLEPTPRKPLVLYNPMKGLDFTKKLIAQAPQIQFVAIENLSREGVENLMRKSMCYIDFGTHPGKDRLPREAAIMDLCIVTSKFGSAKFYQDVAIPDTYKFDANIENIPNILRRIEDILQNYPTRRQDFETYRQKILAEQQIFEYQVDLIFQPAFGLKQPPYGTF